MAEFKFHVHILIRQGRNRVSHFLFFPLNLLEMILEETVPAIGIDA
jgi:hypothetical protein